MNRLRVILVFGLLGAFHAWACNPAKSAAESVDETEQLDCVMNAHTRAEADACRDQVKARFAAPDAGKD